MVTGLGIPAAAVRLQRVPVQTVTLVAAQRVHAAVFAGPRLHPTLIQILVTGLARVSWVASALLWSNTLSMFTALLTVSCRGPSAGPGSTNRTRTEEIEPAFCAFNPGQ